MSDRVAVVDKHLAPFLRVSVGVEVWLAGRFGSIAVSNGRDQTDRARHVASRVLQCFASPPLQLQPDVSMLSEIVSLCFSSKSHCGIADHCVQL